MDLSGKITAYESGTLSPEEIQELFQELINSGIVWALQGHYGRTASALIKSGECTLPPEQ